MISDRYRNIFTFALLGLIILYMFFTGVIYPPFHGYYTTDENFVADSGVLMWYGNTPRGLDWPAAPSMLFFFVAFGVACVKTVVDNRAGIHGLVSVFESFDATAYNYLVDREPYILLGRIVQILAVGFILYKTIRLIYKSQSTILTDSAKMFLPVILVASTIVLGNMQVLRPEAISGSLFIFLVAKLLFTDKLSKKDILTVSVLFGLMLAQRLIFAFFFPFFMGAVFILSDGGKVKNVLYALLFVLLAFIIFCPFIISDTLVVLKSFVGGIIAKINDKPMGTFFNMEYVNEYFSHPVHYLLLILSGLGIFNIVRQKKALPLILIGNFFIFLFLVLRSSKIYDTHVLPAGVVNLFLIGFGLDYLCHVLKNAGLKVSLAFTVIIILFHVQESVAQQERTHRRLNMHAASEWINTLPSGTRMLLNPEFEFYIPKTKACLIREQRQNLDTLKMITKMNFLLGNREKPLSGGDLPVIAEAFSFEDERQYDAQYRILIKYAPVEKRRVYDYDIYFDAIELASHSVQTQEAIEGFRNGKYEYMVSELTPEGLTPIKTFRDFDGAYYYVYKREK